VSKLVTELKTIQDLLNLFNKGDKRKVNLIVFFQICLTFLDLLGIAAIGILGTVSLKREEDQNSYSQVDSFLEILGLEDQSRNFQVTVFTLAAVTFLLGRTLLSIAFTRRILIFFSARGASLSSDLVGHLLSRSLLELQSRSSQETLFSLTRGVEYLVIQVLATIVVLIADASLLVFLGLSLLILDTATAIGLILLFTGSFVFLNRYMIVRAGRLGQVNSDLNIKSNEKIVEVISSYRETIVRDRQSFYVQEIGETRRQLASTSAEINFLPYVSKYVVELAIIAGAMIIGGIQFVTMDSAGSIPSLVIFLAAGSRIAPALMRVQQGLITIRNGLGQSEKTLELILSLKKSSKPNLEIAAFNQNHSGFTPEIKLQNVYFSYPDRHETALFDINLNIKAGQLVAIVGPTGSGKSTLADIILGVLDPDSGEVGISNLKPRQAIKDWPGAISYVPQDIQINSGTISENVSLGFSDNDVQLNDIWKILKMVQLEDFVSKLPSGVDTKVGERGINFSGGQRQRLGIARALFTNPKLIVLDEATSALDGDTELALSEAILGLRGKATVIMIAHRLSTVRNADVVVYLESGSIRGVGSFNEVRGLVPDFDRQANLMGL
jgi:ABC-type multidrug transport system fused ATPase/permease subunit